MFGHVQPGPPDPMFTLKRDADNDTSPEKVDLGVGIYRNEEGSYQELEVVKKAKLELDELDLGHDYELTIGDAGFLRLAAKVMVGAHSDALRTGKVSSVQTISGTGANSLGALFISKVMEPKPRVYIGVPTWGNHIPIFQDAGLETTTYPYLDASKHAVNFTALLNTVRSAAQGSIFVLQGCCHNPTGVDLSLSQWEELAREMKYHGHLPFFDTAYQGLGDGLEEDAAGVRVFVDAGIEMLVCQSFSKNFALYGERCGALHFVGNSQEVAANVQDKLRSLIRHTYSSAPAYGSRLVKIVLNDAVLRKEWTSETDGMRKRLKRNRQALYDELAIRLKTPGDWSYLVKEKGLFSCLALSPSQCRELVETYHVHLPGSGRINLAGLSEENVKRAAQAIDKVTRTHVNGKL
ncbi:aspartate aminotransferase [Colletotrichum scovillei]|uniref:Aspartate aminotransferase n=1 Tax=Colletotrichum scovillei TaxID=1209932 RepID=A0A9P7QU64_9PEZI|nr:aspartate aminotransferase [Colletotrichum scovillei]KAG7043232.1 aspartate aminotransferase [Colletotrichum scovillei]KAG7062679.1 aspartate aminotransferase [Colletotrichum scovillei]